MQYVNVLTLFISRIPKSEETSGQIRRTRFKMLFQLPNLSKTALFSRAKLLNIDEFYVRAMPLC